MHCLNYLAYGLIKKLQMKKTLTLVLSLLIASIGYSQNNETIRHNLKVIIVPETSHITVTDSVIMPENTDYIFSLNANLIPTHFSKNVKVKKIESDSNSSDIGMDRDDSDSNTDGLKINKWTVSFKDKSSSFNITYEGTIDSPLAQSEDNYQRGFSESPGIINNLGVYLAGSTYWVPTFENSLVTYNLTSSFPEGWKTVSQGERMKELIEAGKHTDKWFCDKPQEEIFLIAAEFNEYSYVMNNGIMAMAFLRTPDEGIANKYLEVTEQYMNMYQELIGKYPYSKFALIENFWETGYGMPSFTLLGEKVIRFPFILHSSYPHELLHNWWGNSVYVDFNTGNWCEGITAYMADHLIKEQRGQGENYRRSTLQKFTNFVNPKNDFPINKFASRYDGPSEAIGYGKSLMMWHMVRRKLGDENFKKGLSLFNENNKYKIASYTDMRMALEEVSGTDLEPFFNQWLYRTGAPALAIKDIKTDSYNNQYHIFITLEQTQDSAVFDIDIPIAVATEKDVEIFVFNMFKKEQDFQLALNSKPTKLVIDPQYDVFRILDPSEVPPTLSKIWASEQNVFVLPGKANEENTKMYQQFAEKWKAADNDNFSIVYDDKIDALPNDKTAWIIGFENRFAGLVNDALSAYGASFGEDSVNYNSKTLPKTGNSFTFTVFDKDDVNKSLVFISPGNSEALDGLIRKLPHYGKYSYLAFEGDEPVNIAKGQWPVINSPLVKVFEEDAQNVNVNQERKALAYVKPVFSEKRMMGHIEYLASEELKGRGIGTPEIDEAAQYIADQFKEYGLKPMSDSYYQTFTHTFPEKETMTLKNVIAIIQGTDEKLKNSPVVVSAHYDHLGLGWPDVRQGNEGKIHYGADDNASGISIMLELAKNLSKTNPSRTIIFAAFTAEEAGLIGSRYFVSTLKQHFDGEVIADVNLDTDGRLFDKKLLVLNSNSAKEWKFIFMGTDYTTGIKSELIQQDLDASDQFAFIEKGIPAVQLFTGATPDYHRPSDTYEKIDGPGLVKVATITKEVVVYLADRDTPMEYTGKAHTQNKTQSEKPKVNRKVSTGTIPDFSFTGEGVKVGSVIEGSAGEKAGLKKGDIIVALNKDTINNLKEYSETLKKYQPDDVVKLTVLRDGKEEIISLKLGAR